MTTKKKLIRIEPGEHCPNSSYSSNIEAGLSMAFLGSTSRKSKDGFEVRPRLSSFTTCRELLAADVRAMTDLSNSSMTTSSISQKSTDFDFENLRLLLSTKITSDSEIAAYKKYLFAGKRALNLLEEFAGWESRSVITTVKDLKADKSDVASWMITGPKEWIISPQMLSFSTLILRMSIFLKEYDKECLNTESVESMLDHLKQASDKATKKRKTGTRAERFARDSQHFQEIYKYILPILKNHKKLFSEDYLKAYPRNTSHFSGYGGITTLVKCATADKDLVSKFKKLILKK